MKIRYFGLSEGGKQIISHHIKKEPYDHYNKPRPLFKYTLPCGSVLREELQCELWYKGPCYFLALKNDLTDRWVEKSKRPVHDFVDLDSEVFHDSYEGVIRW